MHICAMQFEAMSVCLQQVDSFMHVQAAQVVLLLCQSLLIAPAAADQVVKNSVVHVSDVHGYDVVTVKSFIHSYKASVVICLVIHMC